MTLGEKLQKLRKSRSWTQEELAERVGVSRQSLSKWESDGALPDTANVIVLADLFGVTTDYLLRAAAPDEAAADAPAASPVVQLVTPPKKAPPAALLIGCILVTLGLMVFLGLVLLSNIFPVTFVSGGSTVRGIYGFLRSRNLQDIYHLSLFAILVGGVIIAVYLGLRKWINRRKDADSAVR